jgi:hypothetical protein
VVIGTQMDEVVETATELSVTQPMSAAKWSAGRRIG